MAQPTAATKEVEAPKSSNSNDFSAAIASIGTAIGELKDALPSLMERAVTTAITSDSTNNALYDAIASATYDSIGALHDDGKLGPNEREKSSETESRNGRGFTRAELLAIETLDQNEQLVNAISTAFDKSLEKSKFDRAVDVGATAAKTAADTTIDATAEATKGVGKTGLSVGLEATRGTLDLVGQLPAGVIESVVARNPGPLLDRLFGSLEKTSTNVIDKGVDGMAETAKNVSSKTIDNVKKGASDVRDVYAQGEGEGEKPKVTSKAPVEASSMTLGTQTNMGLGMPNSMMGQPNPTGADISRTKMLTDAMLKSGLPVMPGMNAMNASVMTGTEQSRKKMLDDVTLNFMTRQAPDFISKGNAVFDKILNDELKIGGSAMSGTALPGSGSSLFTNGAILATLAGAGLSIVTAGKGIVDYINEHQDASKKIDEITDSGKQALDKYDEGWNSETIELRKKHEDAIAADAKFQSGSGFAEIPGSPLWAINKLAGLGNWIDTGEWKDGTELTQEANTRKMQELWDQIKISEARDNEFLKIAQSQGIDRNDREAMMNLRKKFDAGELAPVLDAPAMAAGSSANTSEHPVNAGTGVMMSDDLITADEKMKLFKLYTFEGIRDALLLPEVQSMFSSTARTAGASVEQKLMG